MSEGFCVPPISPDQVNTVRRQLACGVHDAQRHARIENLEVAIHTAKDLEDAKVCMLGLLHLIPKFGG